MHSRMIEITILNITLQAPPVVAASSVGGLKWQRQRSQCHHSHGVTDHTMHRRGVPWCWCSCCGCGWPLAYNYKQASQKARRTVGAESGRQRASSDRSLMAIWGVLGIGIGLFRFNFFYSCIFFFSYPTVVVLRLYVATRSQRSPWSPFLFAYHHS